MRQMTPFEIGWVAGIIDGEGCVAIDRLNAGTSDHKHIRKSPTYRLVLHVTMCDEPTIEHLHRITGVGNRYKISKPQKEHYNQVYGWSAVANQAAELLEVVRPYLVTKAKEVDLALAFQSLPKTRVPRQGTSPGLTYQREDFRMLLKNIKPRSLSLRKGKELKKLNESPGSNPL